MSTLGSGTNIAYYAGPPSTTPPATSVSIAAAQSQIQKVTAMSYVPVSGSLDVYLYVFGTGADGLPYYGVARVDNSYSTIAAPKLTVKLLTCTSYLFFSCIVKGVCAVVGETTRAFSQRNYRLHTSTSSPCSR